MFKDGEAQKSGWQKHFTRMAYLVNESTICISSGGLASFLLLPNFRNNLGSVLSYTILELLLVVTIETDFCEDVWWWEAPTDDHS